MTPKEKAEELLDKFVRFTPYSYARQCAIIAVNEVVEQWFEIDTYLGDGNGELNSNYKYWLEVKEEIKKL